MEQQTPAERLNLRLPIRFKRSYARDYSSASLKNISLTGAFLCLPRGADVNLDEKITITFNVSGRQRKVVANIIWMDTSGCGIRFKPFNNRDVQIIDDLMYYVESKKETKKKVLNTIFKVVS